MLSHDPILKQLVSQVVSCVKVYLSPYSLLKQVHFLGIDVGNSSLQVITEHFRLQIDPFEALEFLNSFFCLFLLLFGDHSLILLGIHRNYANLLGLITILEALTLSQELLLCLLAGIHNVLLDDTAVEVGRLSHEVTEDVTLRNTTHSVEL